MNLGDIWAKIANQARLTPQELDFLRRSGNDTQMRNNFVSGNTSADGKLNITFPFIPFFVEKLSANKSELNITIPSGANHLMILTSVRSTDATSRGIYFECNGDSGTNYESQVTLHSPTTTTLAGSATTTHLVLGFIDGTAVANTASSNLSYINNYGGSWYKYCYASGASRSAAQISGLFTSVWKNTSPITYARIYPEAGNLAAGSIVSIYGIL